MPQDQFHVEVGLKLLIHLNLMSNNVYEEVNLDVFS